MLPFLCELTHILSHNLTWSSRNNFARKIPSQNFTHDCNWYTKTACLNQIETETGLILSTDSVESLSLVKQSELP